jgi:hypothetical protein
MRNCPICQTPDRIRLGDYDGGCNIYQCNACGMKYLDMDTWSQPWFDGYYQSDTSADLQGADSIERLSKLHAALPQNEKGLDIGGKWSPLTSMRPIDAINAGEPILDQYDYIVLSHTLEHVYDIPGLMREIKNHLVTWGLLFIEGPIWLGDPEPSYDYHWQHINKFRPIDLENLLTHWGMDYSSSLKIDSFQGYQCWRIVGIK